MVIIIGDTSLAIMQSAILVMYQTEIKHVFGQN